MNTTENQLAIVEKPSDKSKKWPYVVGGFIAGVASIIGAAYLFDDEGGGGSSYNHSSHASSVLDYNNTENVEDIQKEESDLSLHIEGAEK